MIKITAFGPLTHSFTLTTLTIAGLVACQTQPTKVTENKIIEKEMTPFYQLSKQMKAPIEITKNQVIVDVRSHFDYTLAHIPNSIHLTWEEFSQVRGSTPGLLKKNLTYLAKRLALKGISPESQVLVVGKGLHGQGEEGRMAWTLFYLGVHQIQIANIENFHKMLTNRESPPLKNAKTWTPQVTHFARTSLHEILKAAMSSSKTISKKIHILDVRSKQEYFHSKGKGLGVAYQTPNMKPTHIYWKEFFSNRGQVKLNMKKKILAIGIGVDDRILVISNKGVRSGAVTMALLAMGFTKAANYTGGYSQLLTR